MILSKEKSIKQSSSNASGAKSYALAEEQNPKNRPYMEDSNNYSIQLHSLKTAFLITVPNPSFLESLMATADPLSVITCSKIFLQYFFFNADHQGKIKKRQNYYRKSVLRKFQIRTEIFYEGRLKNCGVSSGRWSHSYGWHDFARRIQKSSLHGSRWRFNRLLV
jgi:hypothetical protein